MHRDVGVDEYGCTIEQKIFVADGVAYTIEIKIGGKFRVYEFANPGSYAKFYENVPMPFSKGGW